mgnify:CR=1 FL=1
MGCVDDTRGHVLTVGLGVAAARFSVSPVVRVALKAPKQHQNAQLHNAVRAYSKTDPCVQHHVDPETHELVLAGAGELHLEVAVTSIGMLTGFGAPVVSQPVVSYRETVRETSEVVLAKSSNKLNRLFIRASPLDATLVASLESGDIDTDDATATARVLAKECVVALRVFWCSWLGCHRVLTPLRSRSVQIRLGSAPRQAHLVLGRQRRRSWRSHQRPGGLHHRRPEPPCHQGQRHQRLPTGVRCWRSGFGAPAWRQVRLDGRHGPSRPCPSRPQPDRPCCVPCFQGGAAGRQPSAGAADVPVHGATPRGVPGPSTERRCRSLRSGGRVQRCGGYSSGACTLQGKRGGAHSLTMPLLVARCCLQLNIAGRMPVAKSFGFAGDVRGLSSGRACAAMEFDTWQEVDGSVWSPDAASTATKGRKKNGAGAGAGAGTAEAAAGASAAAELVAQIRERKNLPVAVPVADTYRDVL